MTTDDIRPHLIDDTKRALLQASLRLRNEGLPAITKVANWDRGDAIAQFVMHTLTPDERALLARTPADWPGGTKERDAARHAIAEAIVNRQQATR